MAFYWLSWDSLSLAGLLLGKVNLERPTFEDKQAKWKKRINRAILLTF